MRSVALLFGLGVFLVGHAIAAPPINHSLDELKERVGAKFTLAERQDAIRELSENAHRRGIPNWTPENIDGVSRDIIPLLIPLLHDGEPAIRQHAAAAFCGLGPEVSAPAIPILIELLSDPDARVRQSAVTGLMFRAAAIDQALAKLTNIIKADPAIGPRESAANALRNAGPEAVAALVALLDDSSDEVRLIVLERFSYVAMNMPVPATPAAALPTLLAMLKHPKRAFHVGAALAILTIDPPPPEALDEILKQDDVKYKAVHALLERRQSDQFRDQLIKFFEADADFRRKECFWLGRLGPPAIPMLLKLLEDPKPKVRGHAASALGDMGPPAEPAVPALKKLLTDLEETHSGDLDTRVCHLAGDALARILNDPSYRQGLPRRRPDGK